MHQDAERTEDLTIGHRSSGFNAWEVGRTHQLIELRDIARFRSRTLALINTVGLLLCVVRFVTNHMVNLLFTICCLAVANWYVNRRFTRLMPRQPQVRQQHLFAHLVPTKRR